MTQESKKLYFTSLLGDLNRKLSDMGIKPTLSNTVDLHELAIDQNSENFTANWLDVDQKEELLKEYQSHQRRIRQVFTSFITDLKKTFRPFTKSVEAHLLTAYEIQTPMDLSIMQDKIERNVYELPDDFMNDMRLILSNVIKFNDRDLITKARKLIDSAEEDISLLTPDFQQQCWYFYLFKRSGVIPYSKNYASGADGDKDSDSSQCDDEVMEIPATQPPTDNANHLEKASKSSLDDASSILEIDKEYQLSPIELLPPEPDVELPREVFYPANIEGFSEYLAFNTPSFSVQDLEDLSSAIACQVLQDGRLDISGLKIALNLTDK